MAVKYTANYYNPQGDYFEIEIASASYSGSSTEINAHAVVEIPTDEDFLGPIRSPVMQLILKASQSQTFSDLWTDEQRVWEVTLDRNGDEIFAGWLVPDGVTQDFVNAQFEIVLDVIGGLGWLENLRFEDSSTGAFLDGLYTPLEIIVECLKRTGIERNINVRSYLLYAGLSTGAEVLATMKIKVDRYTRIYGDDDNAGEVILDCQKVLESLMRFTGCVITFWDGEYYVYNPEYVANFGAAYFFRYDSDGTYVDSPAVDFDNVIGHSDTRTVHHVNRNQRIEMRPSLSATRINWKYGLDDSLFANPDLYWNSSTTSDIDGWTELVPAEVANYRSSGSTIWGIYLFGKSSGNADILQSDMLAVSASDALNIELTAFFEWAAASFDIEIRLFDGSSSDEYTLDATGTWNLAGSDYITLAGDFTIQPTQFKFNIQAGGVPVSGNLRMTIQNPLYYTFYGGVALTRVLIGASRNNAVQGEFHSVYKTTNSDRSTEVDDVIEVLNGDSDTNIFYGTIYKNDGVTQTDDWTRSGAGETKPILQLLAEKRMRMRQAPARKFMGDVYGELTPIGNYSIDAVTGTFLLSGMRWDTMAGVVEAEFMQIHTDDVDAADWDYELEYDYGETIKPVITG